MKSLIDVVAGVHTAWREVLLYLTTQPYRVMMKSLIDVVAGVHTAWREVLLYLTTQPYRVMMKSLVGCCDEILQHFTPQLLHMHALLVGMWI